MFSLIGISSEKYFPARIPELLRHPWYCRAQHRCSPKQTKSIHWSAFGFTSVLWSRPCAEAKRSEKKGRTIYHYFEKKPSMTVPLFALLLLVCSSMHSVFAFQANEAPLNYAVVSLKAGEGITEGEADVITDRLRTELFKTGTINIMERDQMQSILKEQGFQQSGACTDQACMVEMGQLLGVQRLVSGSIGRLGSLYMINIRAVDVSTGRIEKIVSADVKGQIEDVVNHLWGLAVQLTMENGSGLDTISDIALHETDSIRSAELTNVSAVDTSVSEEAPVDKMNETAHSTDEERNDKQGEQSEQRDEKQKASEDWRRTHLNANEPGMRLVYNLMSRNSVRHIYTYEYLSTDFHPIFNNARIVDDSPLLNVEIKFIIRAGRFITIDLGPGFLLSTREISETNSNLMANDISKNMKTRFIMPSFCTGANLVFRVFPLKLNIGPILNVNFPISLWSYEREYVNSYLWTDTEINSGGNATVSVSFGFRAGAEILLTKHMGLGLEFLFRPLDFTFTSNESFEDGSGDYLYLDSIEHQISLPSKALGISVNFYW